MTEPRNGPGSTGTGGIDDEALAKLLREGATEPSNLVGPSADALHAYLSGTATPEEVAEVQEVLAVSAEFREEYLELAKEFVHLSEARVPVIPRWAYVACAAVFVGLLVVNGLQYRRYASMMTALALPIATQAGPSGVPSKPVHLGDAPVVLLSYTPYAISQESIWYRAEIHDRERRVVWSTRLASEQLRRGLSKGSIRFPVPTLSIPPGHYKFFFVKEGDDLGTPSEFDTAP